MFKMMVTPWRDASPYLGIGTYYLASENGAEVRQSELINVTLTSPLILNRRQVRMLVQKYGTDAPDQMTAVAGAWTLRREVLQMGHDGIIAVSDPPNKGGLTVVALSASREKPRPTRPDGRTKSTGAQISRLMIAEIPALH